MSKYPGYPFPPERPIRHCVCCGNVYGHPQRQLGPPGNGSLNAALLVYVCDVCYWAFIRWCWEFFGNELPASAIGGFTAEGYESINHQFDRAMERAMSRYEERRYND